MFVEGSSNSREDRVAAQPKVGLSPFLTQKQVAAYLGKSTKTICRMRKRGELHFIQPPGGHVLIPRDAVDNWLDSHYYGPPREAECRATSLSATAVRPTNTLGQPPVSLRALDHDLERRAQGS